MKIRWNSASVLVSLGAVTVVLALRLLLVSRYGSSYPFWDQWDAEIDGLYRRYLDGSLGLADFLRPHNEHRIFFTRLMALSLFLGNQLQFDAQVEMYANLVIYAIAASLLAWSIGRTLPRRMLPLFALVFVAACGVPVGWENTIAGFQNQFYILFGLAVALIWYATRMQPGWYSAALLLGGSTASILTMGSGALLPLALGAIVLLRSIGQPAAARWWLLTTLLIIAFLIGMKALPHVPFHDSLRAHNASDYLHALRIVLSWPLPAHWHWVFLLHTPALIAGLGCLHALRRKKPLETEKLYLVSLAAWSLIQGAAIAYSRSYEPVLTSRYTDLMVVGLLANTALAIRLWQQWLVGRSLEAGQLVYPLLLTAVFLGHLQPSIQAAEERHMFGEHQIDLLSSYQRDGDLAKLRTAPGLAPYPDAERLAATLNDPLVAAFLPPPLNVPVNARWREDCSGFIVNGTYPETSPAPTAAPTRGSYTGDSGDATLGRCWSTPFHPGRAYLLSFMSGHVNASDIDYRLFSDGDDGEVLQVPSPPGGHWAAILVPAPSGGAATVRLKDDSATGWIAATLPQEVGRLTAWSYRLQAHQRGFSLWLCMLGVALCFIGALWGRDAPAPAGTLR